MKVACLCQASLNGPPAFPARVAQRPELLPATCCPHFAPSPDSRCQIVPSTASICFPSLTENKTGKKKPLCFWDFAGAKSPNAEPYIDPELQQGTTPLVKLSGGKATRDFINFRHPTITDADYLGPRAIIDGQFKLVIHDRKKGDALVELFDLQADPAETTNVIDQNAEIAKKLQGELREWQGSVLHSLTGADYQK